LATSEPRHVSSSLAMLVAGFDGETLRHLAAVADARDHPRFHDSAKAAEEIAAMLERGDVPTIGWWKRHTVPPSRPSGNPFDWPPHRSTPAVYTRVILSLLAARYPEQIATGAVRQLALEDGVDAGLVDKIITEALEDLAA